MYNVYLTTRKTKFPGETKYTSSLFAKHVTPSIKTIKRNFSTTDNKQCEYVEYASQWSGLINRWSRITFDTINSTFFHFFASYYDGT